MLAGISKGGGRGGATFAVAGHGCGSWGRGGDDVGCVDVAVDVAGGESCTALAGCGGSSYWQ